MSNPLQHMPASGDNPNQHQHGWRTECIGVHPTAADKVNLLVKYGNTYECRTLVETGLYNGHGSGMAIQHMFTEYVIIDWQSANVVIAAENNPNARVYEGDSAEILKMIELENKPILFWLDAHGIESDIGFPPCPIEREILLIAEKWPTSIVLVDDMCMMGHSLLTSPSVSELYRIVDEIGLWDRSTDSCIMRLVPKYPGAATT